MKITTLKTPPATAELAAVLQKEFSGKYSFRVFGIGKEKSIIVGKSAFVGAQISTSENEITIEGVQPSIAAVLFSFFLQLFAGLAAPFTRKPWRNLEKELGLFLQHTYN